MVVVVSFVLSLQKGVPLETRKPLRGCYVVMDFQEMPDSPISCTVIITRHYFGFDYQVCGVKILRLIKNTWTTRLFWKDQILKKKKFVMHTNLFKNLMFSSLLCNPVFIIIAWNICRSNTHTFTSVIAVTRKKNNVL